MHDIILYISIGVATGLFTGLLGGGSGPILIPILTALLLYQGVNSDLVMHLAVGTSLGIAVIAMLASIHMHHKYIPEIKGIALQLLPGGIIGAILGTILAAYLSGYVFKLLFGLVVLGIAVYIIFDYRFNPHNPKLPSKHKLFFISIPLGTIATCFGVGMGPLCVPLLKRYGLSISKAIAIATITGGILVIFAAVGFAITGYNHPNLPAYSLGYIYLPMLMGIGIPSIVSARIGAKLTHKFSARTLKIIFSSFLAVIGIKMLF